MKDTGRNTNKIENNKKIVKEKEKSNKKKNKTKRIYQQKMSKIFVRERKKTINMKVMLLNLKIKALYCSVLGNHWCNSQAPC